MSDEIDISLAQAIRGSLRFRRRLDYLKPVVATILATGITTAVHLVADDINEAATRSYWRSYENQVDEMLRYD